MVIEASLIVDYTISVLKLSCFHLENMGVDAARPHPKMGAVIGRRVTW